MIPNGALRCFRARGDVQSACGILKEFQPDKSAVLRFGQGRACSSSLRVLRYDEEISIPWWPAWDMAVLTRRIWRRTVDPSLAEIMALEADDLPRYAGNFDPLP